MSPRTTHTEATQSFVVDPSSITLNGGRNIDWANVPDSYKHPISGNKVIPAGKVMGETADGMIPRVAVTAPAVGLIATQAVENEPTAAKTGYGVIKGGVLYENLLPDADEGTGELAAELITELQAAGTGFAFELYEDNRNVP